jgi:hypothetical protein
VTCKNIQQLFLKNAAFALFAVYRMSLLLHFKRLTWSLPPSPLASPHPNCFWPFHLHVGDGLSGGLLVRVTATFNMLHFFLLSTSGSFFALHLLVPESPSFTSKSLTIVFFLNAKVK